MRISSDINKETLVSIHEQIFLIGYSRQLVPLVVLGAVGVLISLPFTYSQITEELKTGQVDFLNSSAVGPGFIRYLTYLGEEEFFMTMIPFLMYFWDIPIGIVYAFLVAASVFFSNWLKELFCDSRPLWFAGDGLDAGTDGCSTEYGQPSTHSFMAVNLLLFPLTMFTVTHSWLNPWLKMLGYAFFSVLVGLVAWSRLTLAVHFPYQVALGVSLGLVFMPTALFILAFAYTKSRNCDIRSQSISAGVIMILGNIIGMVSMRGKPKNFDEWLVNTAVCEKDKMPDEYAAMDYVLGGTGMLAFFPYILCYHKSHELEPHSSKPIWVVKCTCFVSSIAIAFSVFIFWEKVIIIDANYWRGIVSFEILFAIIALLLALFLPMIYIRARLLQIKASTVPDQISADEANLNL